MKPEWSISDFSVAKTMCNACKDIRQILSKTTLEPDSHADTCVIDRNASTIMQSYRPVTAQGYDPALGSSSNTYDIVSGHYEKEPAAKLKTSPRPDYVRDPVNDARQISGYFDKQDPPQKRSVAQGGTDDSETATLAVTDASNLALVR